MKIARSTLLAVLHEVAVGVSRKETIEQSNTFVFQNGILTAFNDAVLARTQSPLDFEAAVNAPDLLALLGKIPDEEVDIELAEGEVIIKGKRKSAGIACTTEILLPIDAVPQADQWTKLPEAVPTLLQQAARTCSADQAQYLATCVHITPELIEACDNFRLFRATQNTGFPGEVLIPAASLSALDGIEIKKVAQGEGWTFFRTASRTEIAVRCSHEPYHDNIGALLDIDDAKKIVLPANMADMIERAEIMNAGSHDSRIGLRIEDGYLTITSRKDSGWYKERKRIDYHREPLEFDIHPKFLTEIMARSPEITVGRGKMMIQVDNIQFLVQLFAKDEKPEPAVEEEHPTKKAKVVAEEGDIPF
jgi:hypothetical protein